MGRYSYLCVMPIDISYSLDSASVHQKVKPKILAVSPHNNRRWPYWSFPLIKKMLQKSFIKDDLYSTLCTSAIQNTHIPCQLRGNDQRLRSGFNFRLPTVWDAPSSVHEIAMVMPDERGFKFTFCVLIGS